jgi:hypothetical protein
MAMKAAKERGICIRVACQAFRIKESCYRYERKLGAANEEVATWLITRVRHQMTQVVDSYRSPYFFTTTKGSFARF